MPLTKSNSESGPFFRHRSPWQRSRSNPVPAAATRRSVQVSAATKTKLNKFQFQATETINEDNKENEGQNRISPTATAKDDSASTPVTRLSWRDLEPQASQEQEENVSPTERLLWNNKQDPAYQTALSPMLYRKNRKRARSSSPTSSPSNEKPATPAVDVKKLTEALRSPHADPTLELWDRFSTTGRVSTPIGLTNPALAQLMVSSSPRPAKGGSAQVGERSLRKAISYGRNIPKRRRLERLESPNDLSKSDDEASKTMLVSALLDTVTCSMQETSPQPAEALDAASPSRKRQRDCDARSLDSPSKAATFREPKPNDGHISVDQDSFASDVGVGGLDEAASDYGDDIFDDTTLHEIEAGLDVNATQDDPTLINMNKPAVESPAQESLETALFLDEFDDLDDDALLNAASVVMTKIIPPHASTVMSNCPDPGVRKSVQNAAKEEPDDMFGGDDFGDFDFEAAELAATQSIGIPTQSVLPLSQKPKAIQRYLVTNVLENDYVDDRGRSRPEKILLVQVDNTKIIRTIHLRDEWYDTPVSVKAYVHVIGDFSAEGRCIIDDGNNMVILHPDQLISATVVADSFTCMRRAVLQDRVKATGDSSAPLVYGTMLHEIFQEALMANKWDLSDLSKIIDRVMDRHVEDLYVIKVSKAIAREHLQSKMIELSHWARNFVSSQPKPSAIATDRRDAKVNMCVSKLLDVEEHVWSPMYGLKGNIDATVQVTMRDGADTRTLTVPFEVKTGKHANENHMAQTALYTLLLSDRYDVDVACGILYYMESSKTLRIPAVRNELRHMIMQRNRLACFVRERSVQLPPMKRSKNACGKCYAKTSCFIYHKLADGGDGESSGMGKGFDEVVQHLTPTHREFFLKWEDLLTKEEKETQKVKRELWTMVSSEREKVGRCFSEVIIEEGSAVEEKDSQKINKFRYTFIKGNPAPGFSFLESQLVVGEPVVVSDEKGHFALALGYVTAVRRRKISVAVDRRLHNARVRQSGFDEARNQVFASIMDVALEGSKPRQSQGATAAAPIRYRLDKDEFSNGMAVVRNNLVSVMSDGLFGSREIRRLIVDLAPPRFNASPTQYEVKDGGDSLNVDQRRAVEKVMSARDYALVLGMPGTGKTTTIAHIIRALTAQGKSVLLTSYTHTAVDNILLKLRRDQIPILRLGAPAKVHREVQAFAMLAGQPMSSFEEIKEAWHGTPVVATTCLGISHPIFAERTFDYCIVDEASQITLPVCLGPIRMAGTFVLVGDHNQLPPLVRNEAARQGGLDVSLFKLLSDTHPASVVNLEHQYRMCEDVMTLSSTLIYGGRLRCGTEELRKRKLVVPHMAGLMQLHYTADSLSRPGTPRTFCPGPASPSCWLRDLLDPEARVRFVNTDILSPRAREEAKGSRIVNPVEATVVAQLVEALLAAGVAEADVGVMTHYRSQLSLLRHALRGRPGLELDTADRFQGRDKEVVVLSLVRSNEACNIGDLLRDWRRINVAFTRAKTKLLVVGSRDTLRGCGRDEMLSRFVALMDERAWVYDLPVDALSSHCFEEVGTQVGASGIVGGASPARRREWPSPSSSPAARRFEARTPKKFDANKPALSAVAAAADKENRSPVRARPAKTARVGDKVLLKGRAILRDVVNEITNGAY